MTVGEQRFYSYKLADLDTVPKRLVVSVETHTHTHTQKKKNGTNWLASTTLNLAKAVVAKTSPDMATYPSRGMKKMCSIEKH